MKKKLRENQTWYKGIEDDGDCDYVEDVTEDYSDDYINEDYDDLIGKRIRIINMDDPYASERYAGKEGVIENVATDPWGDVYYDGTWGSLSIYPNIDTIEFIDESLDEKFKVVSGTDKDLIEIAKLVEQELLETDPKVDVRLWRDMFTIMIHADGKKTESAVKKFVEDITKGEFSLEIKITPNYGTNVLTCKLVKTQTQTQKNDTPKQTNTNNNQNKQQTNQQKQEPEKQLLVNSLTEDSDNAKQALEKAKADWNQKYEEADKLRDELAKYNIPYVQAQTQDGKTVQQPDFSKIPENERKNVEELFKKYQTATRQSNMARDNYYKLEKELGESLVENIFDEELNTIIDKALNESFITEGKFKDKVKGFISRITKAAAQGVAGGAVGGITAGPIGAAVGAGLGATGDIVKSIVGDIVDWLKGKKSKDNHEIKDAENDIINKLGYAKAKPVLYNMRKEYDNLQFSEDLDEDLFDAKGINYGHKAWVLNQIISSMNDETAYYDTEWLYIWPDGESYEDCIEDFGDKQSFKELENLFISIYKYNDAEEGEDPEDAEYNFHRDGLYNPTQEAVDLAHQYDRKLGLSPIQVIGTIKK